MPYPIIIFKSEYKKHTISLTTCLNLLDPKIKGERPHYKNVCFLTERFSHPLRNKEINGDD